MFKLSKLSLGILAISANVIAFNSAAEDAIERISITGSKIQKIDLESASPITSLSADDLAITGISNLEEVLQSLTVSAGPAGNSTNAYWTSNGYATAQVNLRGLGIKRTLVLLNGQRLVAGGTGANDSPDLNMIPMGLVERIDILKDGASAIYGADAVAGVVNIITKSGVDGAKLIAKIGQSSKKDAEHAELNFIIGHSFETGSAVFNINYVDNGHAMQSRRNKCPLRESDDGLDCIYSGTTIGGRAQLADGQEVQFNQNVGSSGNTFEPYNNKLHGYNWFESLNSYSPMQRLNLSTFFEYNLNENLQLNSGVIVANRRSSQIVTPRGFRAVNVSKDFIYNPTGQDLTLKNRRNIEVDNPEFFQETNTLQLNLGVTGELKNSWLWQAHYNYGRNTGRDGWSYDMDDMRVANSLDSELCSIDPSAEIPCGDFFGVGELSQQVIDYVTYRREGTGGNQLQSMSAELSGDLISLPFGDVAFAAGIIQRKEKGWRNPDPVVLRNQEEDAISGDSEVKEAFIEFSVPLLSDLAFAQDVKLDMATRYSDYRDFEAETTYKLGLTWRLNDSFMLRGVRSSAFRTPTITEQFGGTNTENLLTIDPCAQATGAILINCRADGVPDNFVQDGSTIRTGVGGNPDVAPEKAHTFTMGAVYQSENVSATVDYFNIDIDDAINSVAGTNMLRLCYTDPIAYRDFCNSFTRDDKSKQIISLEKRPMNAAKDQTAGIDLNLQVRGAFSDINWHLNWETTRLLKHENTAFDGAETEMLLGKITSDRGSFAKWKSQLTAGVKAANWQAAYSVQYIGKADDENGGGEIGRTVESVMYHDTQVQYFWSDSLTLALGIDNIFDKKAPFLTSWNDANTDVFTYDTVGRRGYLKVIFDF
ncbi:hypothetical protein PULV_a3049 [Pseudoalteromonas ulvae UL12]|uniref:TonB-dependent receptor domain-containing protein n=1 Tax=Pseudoalteromonas ulvae TaxID=107327 RepID=UPI00186B6D9A|nr:TonB-dependent receptor [Pseudoalteromonas ulvae]MBE0362417.1 hypothetical protein [Pseudoalteromonas ulvae UL12]